MQPVTADKTGEEHAMMIIENMEKIQKHSGRRG